MITLISTTFCSRSSLLCEVQITTSSAVRMMVRKDWFKVFVLFFSIHLTLHMIPFFVPSRVERTCSLLLSPTMCPLQLLLNQSLSRNWRRRRLPRSPPSRPHSPLLACTLEVSCWGWGHLKSDFLVMEKNQKAALAVKCAIYWHSFSTLGVKGGWGLPWGEGQVNNQLFRSRECAQEARSDTHTDALLVSGSVHCKDHVMLSWVFLK